MMNREQYFKQDNSSNYIISSFAHLKALEMRMQKLVLGLSVAQILFEKIINMFLPIELGVIDVLVNCKICVNTFFK